jgi:predicted lipid-binding transport protein (Tim44 family)
MPIDIIVLAAVAIFVLLRLYGVLGEQIGNEKKPSNADSSFDKDSKVIELAPKQLEKLTTNEEEKYENFPEDVRNGLLEIRAFDKSFRLNDFVEGAKSAFEMAIEAIAKNERETLQMLLSKELYESCVKEIEARLEADQYEENRLVAILEAEVIDAYKKNHDAFITVKFVSEQVQVMLDKKGGKIAEFEPQIENVEDSWSFKRDLRNSNPNWTIVAT